MPQTIKISNNLYLVCAIIIGISIFIHSLQEFTYYRALRGIINLIFLLYLVQFLKIKPPMLISLFLILHAVASFLTLGYENPTIAAASMLVNAVSFVLLIFSVFPKVDFKKLSALILIIFFLLISINGYLLFAFVEMLKDLSYNSFHYLFIVISSITLILLSIFTLLYNYIEGSKASLQFTLFVFLLIFAEVFRAIAYYDFAYGNISVYLARILLVIALISLVKALLLGYGNTALENNNN